MKTPTIIGIVLIVIGIVALSVGGFSFTKEKKVVDLGPLQVNTEEKQSFPLPPILGYAALAGGVVLVAAGAFAKKA